MNSNTNKIYISLGSWCETASELAKAKLKSETLPLDWLITYHSLYKIFENNFNGFLNITEHISPHNEEMKIPKDTVWEYNLNYSIRFFHREYETGKGNIYEETIQRRIDRLLKILNDSDKEVVFIRKSHLPLHHDEVKNGPLIPIENSVGDKEDMEYLVEIIKHKYPRLKFKIHLCIDCNCRKYKPSQSNYLDVVLTPSKSEFKSYLSSL